MKKVKANIAYEIMLLKNRRYTHRYLNIIH